MRYKERQFFPLAIPGHINKLSSEGWEVESCELVKTKTRREHTYISGNSDAYEDERIDFAVVMFRWVEKEQEGQS